MADTPCGDPYSKKGPEQFSLVAMVVGAAAGVVGVVMLLVAYRRRVRLAA
jgi:NADH:ubiquinone oxidoreductase subunit K